MFLILFFWGSCHHPPPLTHRWNARRWSGSGTNSW
jgi:hypothetical protein